MSTRVSKYSLSTLVYILFGSKVMPQIQKTKKVQEREKHYTNEYFFTKSQISKKEHICFLWHNL